MSFSGEKTTGDSLNVSVNAPAGTAWTATKGASATWFTFGKESGLKAAAADGSNFEGTGPAVFSIAPVANTGTTERIDTVTLTIAKSGDLKTDLVQKLVVRQAARNLGSLQVLCVGLSQGKVNISATGFADANPEISGHSGERQVKVKATTDWKVVIPAEASSWLTLQQVEGEDYPVEENTFNGYFMLKATVQVDAASREAVVKVVNTVDESIYKEITFIQEAGKVVAPADVLTLAGNTLTWEETDAAGVADVTAASSDWTLTGVPAWLTATATIGDVDTDIELTTIGEAPADVDLTATITVTVGAETQDIIVTWKAPSVSVE